MPSYYLVADVGGTQIRAASIKAGDSTPLEIRKIPTHSAEGTPLQRLGDLLASVWPEDGPVLSLCVAAPGPLDPYEGIIYEAPNIHGWYNLPLKKLLEERFNIPVSIGNDANLAALGEWRFGAGRGHHHLVYLTISTGIGGGVILDDRLILGAHGLATELGHVTILADGPLCGCGQKGHLEAISSGPAIARWAEEQLHQGRASCLPSDRQLTAKDVSVAAQAGDELAKAAFERAGRYLGIAVADILHTFNPTIVIFGGGVSQTGDLLFVPMEASLRQHVISPFYLEGLVIAKAALGDEVGLMGSLAMAQSLAPA